MNLDEARAELTAALNDAVADHDQVAIAALQSALDRLATAATEHPELSEHEVQFVLSAEVDERENEAAGYDRMGEYAKAERMRAEADVLARWTV